MKKLLVICCLLLSQQSFANEGCENYYSNINGTSYTTTVTNHGSYHTVNTYKSIDLETVQTLVDMYRVWKTGKLVEILNPPSSEVPEVVIGNYPN